MLTVDPPSLEDRRGTEPEAVIREARRRQRRRWLLAAGAAVIAAAGAAALAAVVVREAGRPPVHHHGSPPAPGTTKVPVGGAPSSVQPKNPGALALAPNGALYVADDERNQILERLPDGRFAVVAGTGTAGFSGDGGPAAAAEIDRPGGMAVAPDGTLYFADQGNHRIRTISPAGTITTVEGNGRVGSWVTDGTPALDAALFGPSDVALSPSGEPFVADGVQVLALEPDGSLTSVLGSRGPYGGLTGVGGSAADASADSAESLAFNAAGDLFVFGFATKSLLMVGPKGVLSDLSNAFYTRGFGLAAGPRDTVLATDTLSVLRVSPGLTRTLVTFDHHHPYLGVKGFAPLSIAVAPDGTMYVDTSATDGYSSADTIDAIAPDGHGTLLWRAGPHASDRSAR